ncbi:hypothetical protein Dimus_026400 [Dionaea muscipula]
MVVVIPAGSPVPFRRTMCCSTYGDDYTCVLIHVYAGDNALTVWNFYYGMVALSHIKAGRRGIPQIDVTFHVDGPGVLHVIAEDVDTSSKATTIFTDLGG